MEITKNFFKLIRTGRRYTFDLIRGALETLRNQYGSLYLRSSRTIFTNGNIDPKMYNGIIYTNDPESIALNIEGKCEMKIRFEGFLKTKS